MEVNKTKCPNCGSYNVITNMDGTIKCNDCNCVVTPDLKSQVTNVASKLLNNSINTVDNVVNNGVKSRIVAALLAFFFGVTGAQYYYLGSFKKGILCILISCTLIGILVTEAWGVICAFEYLFTSNDDFNEKYSK